MSFVKQVRDDNSGVRANALKVTRFSKLVCLSNKEESCNFLQLFFTSVVYNFLNVLCTPEEKRR